MGIGWLDQLLGQNGLYMPPGAGAFPAPPMAQPPQSVEDEGKALWERIAAEELARNTAADRRNAAGMKAASNLVGANPQEMLTGMLAPSIQMALGDMAPAVPQNISPFAGKTIQVGAMAPPRESAPQQPDGTAAPVTPKPAAAAEDDDEEKPAAAPVATAPAATPSDTSARRRAPLGMAPVDAPVATAPQPGILDRIGNSLNDNSLALMAMGAGFLGAPSIGEGGSRALAAAVPVFASQAKTRETAQNRNATVAALRAKGVSDTEIAGALGNADLMKALVNQHFGKEKAEKTPTIQEFTTAQGSVKKQWNSETKTWDAIPGFEKPVPDNRDNRRPSVSDITKLSEEGGKMEQVRGFAQSFKPQYAGWKSDTIGNLANEAGRKLPQGIVGKDQADASAWWQDYDRYKNVVRHGLYGASLTKSETQAFLAADITPGMDPAQVEKNLATQARLVENSMRRKGKALIGSGYDADAIAKAFGVDPKFFDEADAKPEEPRRGKTKAGVSWSLEN